MVQGKSKLVKCEICGKKMRARGLTGHMRLIHHIVVKVVTRVVPLTQVGLESDSSKGTQVTQVTEQITTYNKVELVPGKKGGKVKKRYRNFLEDLDAHVKAGKNFMRTYHEPTVRSIMGDDPVK